MNKLILVIDDPMCCFNCPLARYIHMGGRVCSAAYNGEHYKAIDQDSKIRPDWCPLKEAPEKDEVYYLHEWSAGYKKGWNDCVNYLVSD